MGVLSGTSLINIMLRVLLLGLVAASYGGVPTCTTRWEEKCWDEPRQKCTTVNKPHTTTVFEDECHTVQVAKTESVPEKQCKQVPNEVCHTEYEQECYKKFIEECNTVYWEEPRTICSYMQTGTDPSLYHQVRPVHRYKDKAGVYNCQRACVSTCAT